MHDAMKHRSPAPFIKLQRVSISLATLFIVAAASGCAAHLEKADEALTIGNEPEAEVHLRKALKQNASKAEAARQLSILLAKQGNEFAASEPRKAENMFTEALELDPTNDEARMGIARLLMKRGFMADARELLSSPDCRGCGVLMAMILHEDGVKHLNAGEYDLARKSFEEALALGKDPLDALAIAETWMTGPTPDLQQAKASLAAAAPLIARGQMQPENLFRDLRTRLIVAAAAAHQLEMVDELLEIRTPSLAEEPEFELRFKASQEQFKAGDSDPAIKRISSLLETSGQYIDPALRDVMSGALMVMYSARVAQSLQAGDPVSAAKDIVAGLKLDPANTRLALQQVLAIAGNGRLDLAFAELDKQGKSADVDKVRAILHATDAIASIEAGNAPKAIAALDKAEAVDADLPEVHLARAYLLAETRSEDLSKKQLQEARELSAFTYPGGRINQYAGALAHIDRARQVISKQGIFHPWRGPNFEPKLTALEQKIKAFYPYEVRWYDGKGGLLEVASEGGQKDVGVSGPRWLKVTAIASPGKTAEVEVPNVGLVVLEVDGKQIGVLVEAHSHVKVSL